MAARKPPAAPPTCGECGRKVLRARTEAGKTQLLDPAPNTQGNVIAWHDGIWFARTNQGRLGEKHPLEKVYMPHAATCPGPPEIAEPPDPPPDVEQRGGRWR